MLGPAFSVAVFALSGVNVDISRNFRGPFVGLTGVWLGSYFQPSILNDVYIWMISLCFFGIIYSFSSFSFLLCFSKNQKNQ